MFFSGCCFDWCVSNGNILVKIKDIDTFSLTLLQIQATISTWAISITLSFQREKNYCDAGHLITMQNK